MDGKKASPPLQVGSGRGGEVAEGVVEHGFYRIEGPEAVGLFERRSQLVVETLECAGRDLVSRAKAPSASKAGFATRSWILAVSTIVVWQESRKGNACERRNA